MDALKRKMEIAAVAFFCTVTALIAAYSCATTAAANLAQQTAAAPATEYVTLAYMEVQPEAEQELELLYDVPMSDELQRCVREQAERQGVPFEIAIAVIERESSYQPDAVSDTGDFGLMQIRRRVIIADVPSDFSLVGDVSDHLEIAVLHHGGVADRYAVSETAEEQLEILCSHQ